MTLNIAPPPTGSRACQGSGSTRSLRPPQNVNRKARHLTREHPAVMAFIFFLSTWISIWFPPSIYVLNFNFTSWVDLTGCELNMSTQWGSTDGFFLHMPSPTKYSLQPWDALNGSFKSQAGLWLKLNFIDLTLKKGKSFLRYRVENLWLGGRKAWQGDVSIPAAPPSAQVDACAVFTGCNTESCSLVFILGQRAEERGQTAET